MSRWCLSTVGELPNGRSICSSDAMAASRPSQGTTELTTGRSAGSNTHTDVRGGHDEAGVRGGRALNRRQFLSGSLALGAAIAMFGACSSGDSDEPATSTTANALPDRTKELEALLDLTSSPLLDAYFPDPAKAALVGAAYIQNVADGDAKELAIPDDFRARVMEGPADAAAVEALRGEIRSEFTAGDMVAVSGWRLSRTEVQLALIAAGS